MPVPKWIVGAEIALEDSLRVRRDELDVVRERERSDPGVEELDDVGARLDLRAQVADRHLRQLLHQRMPHLWRAVHEALRLHEVTRRLPFDEVAGDRERPAAEADERPLGLELGPHEPHGLEDERHRLLGIRHVERLDVRRRPNRTLDHRPDVLHELDVDAHPEHRQHDVREHHGCVDAVRRAPARA